MELKDPIHGKIDIPQGEATVIELPEFQRLRAIKQLGFAEISFPGATHTRFLHSIGVMHLAGRAFDQIFSQIALSSTRVFNRFRQCVRLAALLHDVGHGPLSHTTEEVMPLADDLDIGVYSTERRLADKNLCRRASHEDYTIKYITASALTEVLQNELKDITPLAVAALIDRNLVCDEDFFSDRGLNYRPLLSQIVSSELDADRIDYLERDAYFCGTNYGRIETEWLLSNMSGHVVEDRVYLALNRRALYTFDDFLISRHHMHLMIYFHHKSIIYEEMLMRYLESPDCQFRLPSDMNNYTRMTDFALHEHLGGSSNPWARRIAKRQPFKMLFELHSTSETERPARMQSFLQQHGHEVILVGSSTRLSKYHSSIGNDAFPIFVVDQYDPFGHPVPVEECTQIFQKYEETRRIDRLYVAPESLQAARELLVKERI